MTRSLNRTARPRIESLEDRWCPSVSVSTTNNGHTLVITGDHKPNAISIRDSATTSDLAVQIGSNTPLHFNNSVINKIVVDLKSDNDSFNYRVKDGTAFRFAKNVQIFAGLGNDTIGFFNEGIGVPGADVNAPLSVAISGSTGQENVRVNLDVVDAPVSVAANLGSGNDNFTVTLTGTLENNAHLSFNANGELGSDSLEVSTTDPIVMDPAATLAVTFKGGLGNDFLEVNFDGFLDGRLTARLDGEGGADLLRVDAFNLNQSSAGILDAILRGGSDNDVLDLTFQDLTTINLEVVNAVIDGGLGQDQGISLGNVTEVSIEL